jgi:ABC-type multidrug transport system fused ATPase/permease subunit
MYVARTQMLLALCLPPDDTKATVLMLPFVLPLGTDTRRYFLGTALYNVLLMVVIAFAAAVVSRIVAGSRKISFLDAASFMRLPGVLLVPVSLLCAQSAYGGIVVVTHRVGDTGVRIIAGICVLFWLVFGLSLFVWCARTFAARYVVETTADDANATLEQELLRGADDNTEPLLASDSDAAGSDNTSADSNVDKKSAAESRRSRRSSLATTVTARSQRKTISGFRPLATANDLLAQLKGGLDGLLDATASALQQEEADLEAQRRARRLAGFDSSERASVLSQEQDEEAAQEHERQIALREMRELGRVTRRVLHYMCKHASSTGTDEDKLRRALAGTAEWRDLDDDTHAGATPAAGASYVSAFGIIFAQFRSRCKYFGAVELVSTVLCASSVGIWGLSTYRSNCITQCIAYCGTLFIHLLLVAAFRPFIGGMPHWYGVLTLVIQLGSAGAFLIGNVMDRRGAITASYVVGIISVYVAAFRALMDVFLAILRNVGTAREDWTSVQELTDIFLAAQHRRARGLPYEPMEAAGSDAASSLSRVERRRAMAAQGSMRLFLRSVYEQGDRYRCSRALPEEFHPFNMRPLPPVRELLSQNRKALASERLRVLAQKAKWAEALQQMGPDDGTAGPDNGEPRPGAETLAAALGERDGYSAEALRRAVDALRDRDYFDQALTSPTAPLRPGVTVQSILKELVQQRALSGDAPVREDDAVAAEDYEAAYRRVMFPTEHPS